MAVVNVVAPVWVIPAFTTMGGTTQTITAATGELVAFSFVGPKSPFSGTMTLSEFRVFLTAATESPKLTAYLYNDTPGEPNLASLVTNGTGVETGVLSGGWNDVTWGGTLPTIVEGTQYWVVVKCTSGTSAQIGVRWVLNPGNLLGMGPATATWRGLFDVSTDGTTWGGTARSNVISCRAKLTDGTDTAYYGLPAYTVASATNKIGNSGLEAGAYLTTPDFEINLKSVSISVRKNGTPGALSLKIYAGDATSATATSNAIPAGNVPTGGDTLLTFDFSTVVALSASAKYRFALSAASGDASNYYYVYTVAFDTDSAAGGTVELRPFACGSCVLSGGSWTDSLNPIHGIGLLPNPYDPTAAAAGGGGLPIFGGGIMR